MMAALLVGMQDQAAMIFSRKANLLERPHAYQCPHISLRSFCSLIMNLPGFHRSQIDYTAKKTLDEHKRCMRSSALVVPVGAVVILAGTGQSLQSSFLFGSMSSSDHVMSLSASMETLALCKSNNVR